MTEEFLDFSCSRGNDLVTPQPNFPGLKEGDRWCLWVTRWRPTLRRQWTLEATNSSALELVSLEELRAHALA